jgi:hypothetical protein
VKTYVAGEAVWRSPVEHPPPLGVKMLLLNPSGVCVIGTWADWALAWAPLPKITPEMKRIIIHGKKDIMKAKE